MSQSFSVRLSKYLAKLDQLRDLRAKGCQPEALDPIREDLDIIHDHLTAAERAVAEEQWWRGWPDQFFERTVGAFATTLTEEIVHTDERKPPRVEQRAA